MSDNNDSDQNFNDAELQDIMSEIESLEKEFVDEDEDTAAEGVVSELDSSESEETPIEASAEESTPEEVVAEVSQPEEVEEPTDDIVSEADIESISQEMVSSQQEEELETPMAETDNITELHVVKEETPSPVAMTTDSTPVTSGAPGEMAFSGSGKLDLSLSFYIGDQQATLKVVDGVGLTVDMDGTTLKFDSEGCHVDIEGGAKINLPLSSNNAAKKAA